MSSTLLRFQYHFVFLTFFRNVEAALGGKSDPYVRVQVNNITKARTEVINNSRTYILIVVNLKLIILY
jgi:Ca2+-dependent lipid-binding protein